MRLTVSGGVFLNTWKTSTSALEIWSSFLANLEASCVPFVKVLLESGVAFISMNPWPCPAVEFPFVAGG